MVDDRWTLHRGDALAVLRDLPTGSVDAVITDPPYSSGGQFRSDRETGSTIKYAQSGSQTAKLPDFSGDNRDQRGWAYWMALWLSEALRVTKPGGVCCLFTDWRQLPTCTDAIQAGGWVWRGIVPWVKPLGSARPQLGRFMAQCEYVIWGSHGQLPIDGPALYGFFEGASPKGDNRQHPTQKPVNVLRDLVKIAPLGGTILDPFAGSGTTGVAALLEGRRFVGVEQVDHYRDVAARRLAEVADVYQSPPEQSALDLTA